MTESGGLIAVATFAAWSIAPEPLSELSLSAVRLSIFRRRLSPLAAQFYRSGVLLFDHARGLLQQYPPASEMA